jgi:hypothetical protein
MRLITFLLFFLSLYTRSAGQLNWQHHTETESLGIRIQNSLPKGGVRYVDATGKDFVYVVFWTRVMNEATTPLELTINFPADSFPISASPSGYLKLFLHPDTMTYANQYVFNYGLTDLNPFFNAGFHKPTRLQRTISPKEEWVFYVVAVSHKPYDGALRAEFILKDRDLFYKVNMLDPELIPCGQIVFRKSSVE